jgi:predicted GH43/DUF377 family glycosyl hydrolase
MNATRYAPLRMLVPLVLAVVSQPPLDCHAQPAAAALQRWLVPQRWTRDTDGPVLSLGPKEAFDDQHIFAPCVIRESTRYLLWYCGSRGTVEDRVFGIGLMTGTDGRAFERHAKNPVLTFDDQRHSILTPTLLADVHGTPIRDGGKLRMWFSSTDFHDPTALHTLHESMSVDGIHWSPPSPALLKGVYAPTILKTGETYRLWYTDVSKSPWLIRYAESRDGQSWEAEPQAVLSVDQPWEQTRLFYPTVREVDGILLMWYGSYWKGQGSQKTALGFAVSRDGRNWTKSPHNPVVRPDADRPWESHYVTSQSLMQLEGGSWRIWYASRTKPPFIHKYFAISTATWAGPDSAVSAK